MSNKTNIEEDIKILENITKQNFSNPMGWTGYYDSDLKELQQAIKNILTYVKKTKEDIFYKNSYQQKPIHLLTIENLKELETHCKRQVQRYGTNKREKEEHLLVLALLYSHQHNETKANAYDSLIEKIKERIKSAEKCYIDLTKPFFDKSINTINTSCMTKKEKEEFINKSNCLMIQKTVYEEVLELLNTQRSL